MTTSRIGKKSRGGSGFVKKSARSSDAAHKWHGDLEVLDLLPDEEMTPVDVLGPGMVLVAIATICLTNWRSLA
eukprot:3314298-Pleurochrysis_carterae.AAC.1